MAPDTSDSGVSLEFHELAAKPPTERGWTPIGHVDVELTANSTGHVHRVPDAEVYLGPPVERGWVSTTGTPIQDAVSRLTRLRQDLHATNQLNLALDQAIVETRQNRDVDRTFENETRLQ